MKVKWLDRSILNGPCLTLATSEDEYLAALKKKKCEPAEEWLAEWASAQVHTLTDPKKAPACIVCIRPQSERSAAELANVTLTMAHEALHIFRKWCEYIGEDAPGEEIEAHCINGIASTLMQEYLDRC